MSKSSAPATALDRSSAFSYVTPWLDVPFGRRLADDPQYARFAVADVAKRVRRLGIELERVPRLEDDLIRPNRKLKRTDQNESSLFARYPCDSFAAAAPWSNNEHHQLQVGRRGGRNKLFKHTLAEIEAWARAIPAHAGSPACLRATIFIIEQGR